MDGQVHVSFCHINKILWEIAQGTSAPYFDVSGSEGRLGTRSFSLLHPDHHAILSCMVHAMGEIISDSFLSHLVRNTREPNHLYKTLVCCFLSC